ncbi:hypothetical protein, partial [Aeromonas sp. EERV15]|uniref:hypothetical protein n=1 Tax=Aeromonas sp. EERV15 TaxID=1833892 RepID=UPI001C400FB2
TSNAACDANLSDRIVGHFDFEIDPGSGAGQIDGTVRTTLDSEGKPVNAHGDAFVTPAAANGWTTGQNNFRWWYRDNDDYNRTLITTIDLLETTPGSFVYERQPFWPLDVNQPGGDPVLESLLATNQEVAQNGDGGQRHNFYFTSEIRYWFQYTAG